MSVQEPSLLRLGPLSADADAPRFWGPCQTAVGDDAVGARLVAAPEDEAVGARHVPAGKAP